MRTRRIFTILCIVIALFSGLSLAAQSQLIIYTYDSFAADWGPGPQVIPIFEKKYGVKVTVVSKGDAGQLLSALILEKNAPRADVAIGIDNNLLPKALKADVFQAYTQKSLASVPASLDFDPSHKLVPFDYGYFSLVWDTQSLKNPPRSLADLTKPEFAKKLILMDPRTSSPGLGFLALLVATYGNGWSDYWQKLKPSILTITPGWDAGYSLFTQGEAPLVWSYTTSPAYHLENDKTQRYQAIVFADGLPRQVEGAGIVKGAAHVDTAKLFLDFVLSADFQNALPLTQWMYPVNPEVKLPDSYKIAPEVKKVAAPDNAAVERALASWADLVSK